MRQTELWPRRPKPGDVGDLASPDRRTEQGGGLGQDGPPSPKHRACLQSRRSWRSDCFISFKNFVVAFDRSNYYQNENYYNVDEVAMVNRFLGLLVGSAVIASGAEALAQDASSAPPALAFPGSFGVPSAVSPGPNTGFVGVSFSTPRGGIEGNGPDIESSVGYSFGNPLDAVSVTVSVNVTGSDPFGDAGSFSVSASRLLRAGGSSVTFLGATVANLLDWGVAVDPTYSAYLSHLTSIELVGSEVPVQLVAGYGSDITRSTDGSGDIDDGLFAGFGLGVSENLSAGISVTATQVNAGFSYSLPETPIGATISVLDILDTTDRRTFVASLSYNF